MFVINILHELTIANTLYVNIFYPFFPIILDMFGVFNEMLLSVLVIFCL